MPILTLGIFGTLVQVAEITDFNANILVYISLYGNKKWRLKIKFILIPLELHHKDGNKFNNNLSNLELLCPNCHAFTNTYRTKNIGAYKNESFVWMVAKTVKS